MVHEGAGLRLAEAIPLRVESNLTRIIQVTESQNLPLRLLGHIYGLGLFRVLLNPIRTARGKERDHVDQARLHLQERGRMYTTQLSSRTASRARIPVSGMDT